MVGRGERNKLLGIKSYNSVKTISLILIIIAIIILLLVRNSHALMRVMVGQEIDLKTMGFNETQTEHFRIRYTPVDEDYINLVADVAEDAYVSVSNVFGQEPNIKTTVVVYPDNQSMASSFGWDKDERAMGVYWAGSIRILSPRVWVSGINIEDQFVKKGPVHHEFAHLMVDEITKGNYNRWWTEGIAQYVEKKITGFEFADPFVNGKELEYYSLDIIEKNFDNLNQQIAYWESLKAVEYIVNEYGEDSLFSILNKLGDGCSMAQSFKKSLGIDYRTFEQNFFHQLEKNGERCID